MTASPTEVRAVLTWCLREARTMALGPALTHSECVQVVAGVSAALEALEGKSERSATTGDAAAQRG